MKTINKLTKAVIKYAYSNILTLIIYIIPLLYLSSISPVHEGADNDIYSAFDEVVITYLFLFSWLFTASRIAKSVKKLFKTKQP